MDFVFGIPSYKRPECKTATMLMRNGVSAENIFVALQDESQLNDYREKHPEVNYIVRHADCAAGNRNTLINALNCPMVLLDDDINGFAIKKQGTPFKSADDFGQVITAFENAVAQAKDNYCEVIGIAATTNDLIARGRGEYSYDCLLQGSVLILLTKFLFNENWKMVEDYEHSLRYMRSGGHILRANYILARKPKNGTNKGGLHDRYASGELPRWITRLGKVYPEFKPNKQKTGGYVRFG